MSRHIVITGGTGGLGRSVVHFFRDQGDQVHVIDLNPGEFTSDVHVHALNILDTEALQKWAQQLPQADVLINLVGGFSMGALHQLKWEDFQKMFDLNLGTAFKMSQALLPHLLSAPAGRIVNVGARQALLGGPGVSAYAASKAALINFTQSLAQEVRTHTLTVNAVVPSTLDTPANRNSMPDADPELWVKPNDLAAVIAFLASTEARAVNGAIVPVYHRA